MFALLEIARIYKALKRFADFQRPICYNDAQNKEMNLIVYYIHTEKYSPKSYVVNFRTQISYSQSEERTIFLTREKIDTSNQNPNDIFSRVRKMVPPIKSHRYVWVSHQSFRFL